MDYMRLSIELPTLSLHCAIPSGLSELETGRLIQYEVSHAAKQIEDELFNRFSNEYERQKHLKERSKYGL